MYKLFYIIQNTHHKIIHLKKNTPPAPPPITPNISISPHHPKHLHLPSAQKNQPRCASIRAIKKFVPIRVIRGPISEIRGQSLSLIPTNPTPCQTTKSKSSSSCPTASNTSSPCGYWHPVATKPRNKACKCSNNSRPTSKTTAATVPQSRPKQPPKAKPEKPPAAPKTQVRPNPVSSTK